MARKKGQTYTAEQKAKIVLELLKEEKTINQIASEYQVTVKSIQNWKRQFLENASLAFDTDKVTNQYKKQIEQLKDENEALAKTLGKTTVKMEWAVGFTAPKFQTPKPDLNSKKSSKYLKHFAQVKQHLTYLFVNFDNKTYQVLDNLVFHETSFCYKTLYTHL